MFFPLRNLSAFPALRTPRAANGRPPPKLPPKAATWPSHFNPRPRAGANYSRQTYSLSIRTWPQSTHRHRRQMIPV